MGPNPFPEWALGHRELNRTGAGRWVWVLGLTIAWGISSSPSAGICCLVISTDTTANCLDLNYNSY